MKPQNSMAMQHNPKRISLEFTLTQMKIQSKTMQDFSSNIKYTGSGEKKK